MHVYFTIYSFFFSFFFLFSLLWAWIATFYLGTPSAVSTMVIGEK